MPVDRLLRPSGHLCRQLLDAPAAQSLGRLLLHFLLDSTIVRVLQRLLAQAQRWIHFALCLLLQHLPQLLTQALGVRLVADSLSQQSALLLVLGQLLGALGLAESIRRIYLAVAFLLHHDCNTNALAARDSGWDRAWRRRRERGHGRWERHWFPTLR